jgi:two-component system cell cycle sensor histidine kinase/response regulator CckA
LDQAFAEAYPSVQPGRHVLIAVTDTGCGMDEDTRSRIFDPFFTTKAPGEGTGLGLSTVYGIVQQSGGTVWAKSEPGEGSTFAIYLPAVDAVATALDPERAAVESPKRGTETILVVEDEAAVRSFVVRVLGREGYTVFQAESAAAALALLGDTPQVDLLLTDVILPGMGGHDLAQAVARVAPGAKVLFMSGYTRDAMIESGRLRAGITLLEKPFTPDALARQVREVLDRER